MRNKIICSLIIIFIIFHSTIFADTPAPKSAYTIDVGDKYIFVMSANIENDCVYSSIGEKYEKVGLYKNDGTIDPIWAIRFYIYSHDVLFISDDGQYLIRKGPWANAGTLHQVGIAFHKNGKTLNQYSLDDIIEDENNLPHTASHFFWMKNYEVKGNIFKLTTYEEKIYSFDIETGDIVNVSAPYKTFFTLTVILAIVAGVIISTIIIIFIIKKVKKRKVDA